MLKFLKLDLSYSLLGELVFLKFLKLDLSCFVLADWYVKVNSRETLLFFKGVLVSLGYFTMLIVTFYILKW
jgi:hypothetical protein